jgi:DNA/RNA endonuclease YhcR with UshA esterase domain
LFTLVLLASAAVALGHHGVATYDTSKKVTVKGVVTSFSFINPHAEIYLDAKDDKGNVQHWIGELTTPNMLTRRGWNKDTLKPGDQITMIGNQSKDGSPGMRVQNVTTSDGRNLDPNGTDY